MLLPAEAEVARHLDTYRAWERLLLADPADRGVRMRFESTAYTLCVLMGEGTAPGGGGRGRVLPGPAAFAPSASDRRPVAVHPVWRQSAPRTPDPGRGEIDDPGSADERRPADDLCRGTEYECHPAGARRPGTRRHPAEAARPGVRAGRGPCQDARAEGLRRAGAHHRSARAEDLRAEGTCAEDLRREDPGREGARSEALRRAGDAAGAGGAPGHLRRPRP
ncbi:DUF5133 domain-containing protein [Streptomyces sp. NRRL S-1521]|uniref:DUF5133 domain-containing protein n=1 Tax=Streptomyces sp. NRRL S-1521 TaxID=1609100 RepID=UPI002D21E973|nr:DUF5133 domain-containing protein [Streptomyces sp. NRRL S-1521]